jgi:hypothetical protein
VPYRGRVSEPFFPEPTIPDPRPGLRREMTWRFLHRSTWSRATEIRAFYNEAVAALPAGSHKPLLDAIRAGRSESALLEIVVGRFLQLRGASRLEHEPAGGRRRVDWRASFPDGVVHVEAMVPVYNAASREAVARHDRLLDVLEPRIPRGWWLLPSDLPAIAGNASLRAFRELADALLARIPPAELAPAGSVVHLRGRLDGARVGFLALRATGRGGLGGGAMISHFDDSEQVIRGAWADKRKREQGRSVPHPRFLAMAGSFLGADLEDFEMALFGRDLRIGRRPDGAMVEDDPPWSGVLAFPAVSPAGVPDPVLFVAPGFAGPLPAAVERLEVRRLTAIGLDIREARDSDVMAGMRWASP